MDWNARAEELLEEFDLCMKAKSRHNAIDIQLEKDSCAKFAYNLSTQRGWGTDIEIAEACNQLEPRLNRPKRLVLPLHYTRAQPLVRGFRRGGRVGIRGLESNQHSRLQRPLSYH